jgi:hypothetical protein
MATQVIDHRQNVAPANDKPGWIGQKNHAFGSVHPSASWFWVADRATFGPHGATLFFQFGAVERRSAGQRAGGSNELSPKVIEVSVNIAACDDGSVEACPKLKAGDQYERLSRTGGRVGVQLHCDRSCVSSDTRSWMKTSGRNKEQRNQVNRAPAERESERGPARI